jgi:hypothetical protein
VTRIGELGITLAVTSIVPMKNGVFWVVTPCGSCKNRRFAAKYFFAAYVGC